MSAITATSTSADLPIQEDVRRRIMEVFDRLDFVKRSKIAQQIELWRKKPCHDYASWQDALVTLTSRHLHELALHYDTAIEVHLAWLEQVGDFDFLLSQMYPDAAYQFNPHPSADGRANVLAAFDPGHPPKKG